MFLKENVSCGKIEGDPLRGVASAAFMKKAVELMAMQSSQDILYLRFIVLEFVVVSKQEQILTVQWTQFQTSISACGMLTLPHFPHTCAIIYNRQDRLTSIDPYLSSSSFFPTLVHFKPLNDTPSLKYRFIYINMSISLFCTSWTSTQSSHGTTKSQHTYSPVSAISAVSYLCWISQTILKVL